MCCFIARKGSKKRDFGPGPQKERMTRELAIN
jgi:hypothetical protein